MKMHVIYNAVISLDGKTTTAGKELMSRADRYRIHELRGSVDAIMTDIETIKIKDSEFGVRTPGEEPIKVIVDDKGEISENAKIFMGEGRVIVAFSKSVPRKKREILEAKDNVEVIVSGKYVVNLSALIGSLYNRNVKTILVESYNSLGRRMLNEGFVDELYVSIMPTFLGEGHPMFDRKIEKKIDLSLEGILQYGNQVVLHYLVKK